MAAVAGGSELSARVPALALDPLDGGALIGVPPRAAPSTAAPASWRSARGLDWFTFFLADIQTGFGPFVAVYLTAQAWSQADIGLVLTAGGLVALLGQIPAGALVDAARSTRFLTMIAVAAISASAIAIAGWPVFIVVLGARVLHAGASCILGPAIAALSLKLVGHDALGERLGRNADQLGGTAAFIGLAGTAMMGLCIVLAMMPETRPTEG